MDSCAKVLDHASETHNISIVSAHENKAIVTTLSITANIKIDFNDDITTGASDETLKMNQHIATSYCECQIQVVTIHIDKIRTEAINVRWCCVNCPR